MHTQMQANVPMQVPMQAQMSMPMHTLMPASLRGGRCASECKR